MRLFFVFMIMLAFTTAKAQTFSPGLYANNYVPHHYLYDSTTHKNWFISKSLGLTAGYIFYKGGNAGIISAPLSLQLNRRISNNLYAFAGISATTSYINFSNAFLNTNLNKTNAGNFFKGNNVNVYPGAAVGLMYINDAKTFSVSGSISIEKTNYPLYYYNPATAIQQQNNAPVYR